MNLFENIDMSPLNNIVEGLIGLIILTLVVVIVTLKIGEKLGISGRTLGSFVSIIYLAAMYFLITKFDFFEWFL